jgi:hypothetical protein
VAPRDEFDSVAQSPDRRVVSQRFCAEAVQDNPSDVYLKACWGLGKTVAFCRRVLANPDLKVIIVSARDDDHPPPDLTDDEMVAMKVLVCARTFGANALEVTPEWFLEKERLAPAYLRLKRYRQGREAPRGALETVDVRYASALLAKALELVGFGLDDPPDKTVVIDVERPGLRAALDELNVKAYSYYGDKNGRRRLGSMAGKATTPRAAAQTISACLRRHFGGELVANYKTKMHNSGGNLSLRWLWRRGVPPQPPG